MTINVPDFMVNVFASWKSSLVGVAAVALGVLKAYNGAGGVSGALHDPATQMLFLVGVLGLVAKDSNVTGGSVGQPSTAAALQASNVAPHPTNPPKEKP